jgi:hypothetical protein
MLQNRVDPWGNIIKTSARGAWMGNRGVLHDEHRQIRRSFKHKAWIICVLAFKGRKRVVMSPNRWTELFFLDEATAFSAGHRPCFECRRAAASSFKSFWIRGNPEYQFTEATSIVDIDAILHRERIDLQEGRVSREEYVRDLPRGSFVVYQERPFVVTETLLLPWSPFGYGEGIEKAGLGLVRVLTPGSVVNAFRAGYVPQVAVTG